MPWPNSTLSKKILILLLGCSLLLGALGAGGYLFSYGGSLVLKKANSKLALRNLSLESASIKGNPLRGFRLLFPVLRHGENVLAEARELTLELSLPGLLEGTSPAGKVLLRGCSLDLAELITVDFRPREGSSFDLTDMPSALRGEDCTLRWGTSLFALPELFLARPSKENLLELRECRLTRQPLSLDLRGTLKKEEGRYILSSVTLKTPDSPAPLAELRGTLYPGQNLELDLRNLSLETAAPLLPPGAPGLSGLEGLLSGKIALSGNLPQIWETTLDLTLEKAFLWGLKIASGALRGSGKEGEPLEITFSAREKESSLAGELQTRWPFAPETALRLRGTSLDLGLGEHFRAELSSLSGTLTSLDLGLHRSGEEHAPFSGHLLLEGGRGTWKSLPFELAKGTAALEKSRLKIAAKGAGAFMPLELQGSLNIQDPNSLEATLISRNAPLHRLKDLFPLLEPLRPEGNLDWEITLRGNLDNPELSGSLHSEKIRLQGELLEHPKASWTLKNSLFTLRGGSLKWKDIALEGKGTLKNVHAPGKLDFSISAAPQGSRWIQALVPGKTSLKVLPGGGLSLRILGTPEDPRCTFQGTLPPLAFPGGTTGKGSLKGHYASRRLILDTLTVPLGKGTLTAQGTLTTPSSGAPEAHFQGTLKNLLLDRMVPEDLPLKGLVKGTFSLKGPLAAPKLSFSLQAPHIFYGNVLGQNITCEGALGEKELRITAAKGELWDGTLKLAGSLPLSDTSAPLNLKGTLENMDLMNTQDLLDSSGIYLKGRVGGTLALTGSLQSPRATAELEVPELLLNSLLLREVKGTCSFSGSAVEITSLRGRGGGSAFQGSLRVAKEKGSWKTSFRAEGKDVEVESLVKEWGLLDPANPLFPRGKGDFVLRGEEKGEHFEINGTLESPLLRLGKIALKNISLPVRYRRQVLSFPEARASLYQGELKGEGQMDLSRTPSSWKAKFEAKGVEMEPFLEDLYPLGGTISGTGSCSVTLEGPSNSLFMTSGEGQVHVTKGAFRGFPRLTPLLEKSDLKELLFDSLALYFSVDGKTLYFMPGSRLTAPPGHVIYRHFSAEGTLPFTGNPMRINCYSEVNAPAINAFLGAFAGFLESVFLTEDISRLTNLTKTLEDALLGGIFGGLAKKDFREISFTLRGTMEAPSLENLKIAPSSKKTVLFDPLDKEQGGENRSDIQLTFTFPTGKGGKETSEDLGTQLKDQILEQAIKQVLPGD